MAALHSVPAKSRWPMLPDWDFGGDDAKRREFIAWVWDELDRFALLTAGRVDTAGPDAEWSVLLDNRTRRVVGRPVTLLTGLNAMVWEFGLLRYMFGRYWPGRKRRLADPASAASIAVARCQHLPPRDRRTPDRLAVRRARDEDRKRQLFEEWERGTKSAGRREAELDAAYLNTLPANLFAR